MGPVSVILEKIVEKPTEQMPTKSKAKIALFF